MCCCTWSHGLQPKKNFKLAWRCYQLLSGFLAKGHFLRVSRESSLSANDNEITPEAVHRSPGICLTAEENSGKPQLGHRRLKAVRKVIPSNGVCYLQMRSVGSHSTSGMENEGKRKGLGGVLMLCDMNGFSNERFSNLRESGKNISIAL